MRQLNKKGFTLIELLVVIAIIATLTTVAVVALGAARRKARDAKRIADIKAVQNALELYYLDTNSYPQVGTPSSPETLGAGTNLALCTSGFAASCGGTEVEYMKRVPIAPTPLDGSCTTDQNSYRYSSGAAGLYDITFCLGDVFGDYQAGPHIATEEGIDN